MGNPLLSYGASPVIRDHAVVSRSLPRDPIQVNAFCSNPSHTGRYSIYLPRGMEGWVDIGADSDPTL